ncbi:autotransporter outer membrane beta-barrel domain-containing protein [Escherichia coli]|nr:autotransporter outer membrane beta-barrel domain-containing protein [Escherichia coli]
MSKLTVDNSTVYISRADGKDFEPTRLTITENYVGNNGVLHLRTELGDDNSATDKVVINGNTSGTTRVKVTNAGGSGAYTLNGIEIISVEGNQMGNLLRIRGFSLMLHEYSLTRGNTEATNKNWYLTNFQATSGGETNSEEVQRLLLRLPPSCAPKLEVTSLTWQLLTLFLLCV